MTQKIHKGVGLATKFFSFKTPKKFEYEGPTRDPNASFLNPFLIALIEFPISVLKFEKKNRYNLATDLTEKILLVCIWLTLLKANFSLPSIVPCCGNLFSMLNPVINRLVKKAVHRKIAILAWHWWIIHFKNWRKLWSSVNGIHYIHSRVLNDCILQSVQYTHCWKDYSEKKNDQLTSQIQIMKILC